MYVDEQKVYDFIIDSGLVPEHELARAKNEAHEKKQLLGDVLISKHLLDEEEVRRVQAHVLGIPYVNLQKTHIDFDILSLIPEPVARNSNVVAYEKKGNKLLVAMLDVDDLKSLDFIHKKVGLKIVPHLTDTESIKKVLLQYQKSLKAEFGDIIEKETGAMRKVNESDATKLSGDELKKAAEDLPVVRIVDTLLKHAILQGASDIHIEPMEKQLLIRYRIDGILRDAMTLPKYAGPSISARIKVLADLKLDEHRLPQDGRFKIELEGEKVSFRVSALPTYYGEKTVMRLLRENVSGFTLETLGFHGENLERIHWATRQTTGMILATGPTGSGKSTTLYTILDLLNTPEVNISTIEDPIEYQISRINQTQVHPDIGFSFANGLRSLMRQDPDIIMVGEIRDEETASLAVNAALTGHLVLSTLHTNSASGAIPRLVDMGLQEFLIVSTVRVVIGQRLVRKLTEAKEEYTLSNKELETLNKSTDLDRVLALLKKENVVGKSAEWKDIPFYKPVPTDKNTSGYHGRIGIHEVLKISDPVVDLIMRHATADEVDAQAREEGMTAMIEDGIFKAAQGVTTIEEVLRVVSE